VVSSDGKQAQRSSQGGQRLNVGFESLYRSVGHITGKDNQVGLQCVGAIDYALDKVSLYSWTHV
jgi:hypothetical protein